MNLMTPIRLCGLAMILATAPALAEESFGEKVQEVGEDTVKYVGKGGRAADTWICETVQGKKKCWKKRVSHEVKDQKNEIDDKANDLPRKID